MSTTEDFLFNAPAGDLDPEIGGLVAAEEARQAEKLIMIASESICPRAVKEPLSSVFTNLYAEGYAHPRLTCGKGSLLTDLDYQLAYQRRYADKRYYKGCEFVNFVEALAIRRVSELFANECAAADKIFANVQPLSGAAANNAIYEAFTDPGDTVMGLDLTAGGHLTHGSPVNRSGKRYAIVSYGLDPKTGRFDFDALTALAEEARPKMIFAGYSAYPWQVDWTAFRKVCDAVGALLIADISHNAGTIAAGLYPNPVGIADAVMFTTHKSLCGPRGGVILTTDPDKAKKIDMAVFPGEQGGPHINNIAAKAVAFQIAATDRFRKLQAKILENCAYLGECLEELGLGLAYGGTDTHLLLVDLKSVGDKKSEPLSGEIASRILDLAGITCNKNTIAGDTNAVHPSAIRLGTTFVTQRGITKDGIKELASIIHTVLTDIVPFSYTGRTTRIGRGKIPLNVLRDAAERVTALERTLSREIEISGPAAPDEGDLDCLAFEIRGERARSFLHAIFTNNLMRNEGTAPVRGLLLADDATVTADAAVIRLDKDADGIPRYLVLADKAAGDGLSCMLRGLSDGYIAFDRDDTYLKIDGPVVVTDLAARAGGARLRELHKMLGDALKKTAAAIASSAAKPGADAVELYRSGFSNVIALEKAYFIGQRTLVKRLAPSSTKETYRYKPEESPAKKSCLYDEHLKLTAEKNIIEFAGWQMPVWYRTISAEHVAVRTQCGLFDLSHMAAFSITGPDAVEFIDLVATNYAKRLQRGQSCYSALLYPDGRVIDDIMIYKKGAEAFLVVANAVNADKVAHWLRAVLLKRCVIDPANPSCAFTGHAELHDLKDPAEEKKRLINLALQGPRSEALLAELLDTPEAKRALSLLKKNEFADITLSGMPVMVARTGYTGEAVGFEFYVHPDNAPKLWNLLLERGRDFGIMPCGLGARDSLRTEAGLPLYGHELGGDNDIGMENAGYGSFVKLHKPFFVGRDACIERAAGRTRSILRFVLNRKGARKVSPGDALVSRNGVFIGRVTSCALVDGLQTGMGLAADNYTAEGTEIAILPAPKSGRVAEDKGVRDLAPGDRVVLSEDAVVAARFRDPETG